MGDDDAQTVAEPEGEIDVDEEAGEGEAAEGYVQEVQSRQPVLVFDTDLHVEPELAHFRAGVSVPIFNLTEPARLIDYATYTAYLIIHLMHKFWPAYTRWMDMPLGFAKENFKQGKRHDALGNWDNLAEVDPERGVPRMVQ